jgi:GDP-4-dehydro-6-deoxy-D-mannose reductase
MPGPILVTGAAGFAGSHLIDHLLATGADNLVAVRRPESAPVPGARGGVRWIALDLLDDRGVDAAIADLRPSQIYHLAGAAHVAQSWADACDTYALNVRATHHLVEAVRRRHPEARVLVTGSATVYRPGDAALTEESPLGPASPYATSKLAQELVARHAATDDRLAVVFTRSFNHIGPRQDASFVASSIARQIARIEAGRQAPEIAVGNLDARRDLMDVRDTVRAYAALMAAGRTGVPYNVCSGRAVAIRALLDGLVARARVPVAVIQDPARMRPNDVPLMLGSFARLEAETGWRPAFSLDETLDLLLDDWRARTAD